MVYEVGVVAKRGVRPACRYYKPFGSSLKRTRLLLHRVCGQRRDPPVCDAGYEPFITFTRIY